MKNSKLYETHVYTRNIEGAVEFYKKLDLELAYILENRRAAFFWLGDGEKKEQMLGIWEVDEKDFRRSHFALHIDLEGLYKVPAWLEEKGIPVRESFGLQPTEPIVHAWMPSASYYFTDPDGNSLEYITVLDGESRPELGAIYLSAWEKREK